MARQLKRWLALALLLLPAMLSAQSYDTDGFDSTNAFDTDAWDFGAGVGGGAGENDPALTLQGVSIGL